LVSPRKKRKEKKKEATSWAHAWAHPSLAHQRARIKKISSGQPGHKSETPFKK
jgi:hypothetical protein